MSSISDSLKASMKNCGTDLDNWKNVATDHSAWRSQVSVDIANMEE